MTIGIVGLGLIGGSMAKGIKENTDHRVLGQDLNEETNMMAAMSGSVDGTLSDENIRDCDLLLLAIPPAALLSWVESAAPKIRPKTLLVDLCGVKRVICRRIAPLARTYGFRFIGGHPMAGKEVSGFTNASSKLFRGASMILTPDEYTQIDDLDRLKVLFLQIGFDRIAFSDAANHDRLIAYTSQLAHITSSAYVKSPTAQEHFNFSAGSFRDLTRVARLDPDLWTELFMANTDYLTGELRLLIDNLTKYLRALEARDPERLRELLQEGRALKATAGGD